MRKITFLCSELKTFDEVLHYHQDIHYQIKYGFSDIIITDLSFLSFDLLDEFFTIELFYGGVFYNLKLGKNDWTEKELRKEHNLLKLVRSFILEK